MLKKITIIFFFTILAQSCSLNTIVIRQTGDILNYGVLALYEETDLQLAEQALAADIKLVEGLIKGDPENKQLLIMFIVSCKNQRIIQEIDTMEIKEPEEPH